MYICNESRKLVKDIKFGFEPFDSAQQGCLTGRIENSIKFQPTIFCSTQNRSARVSTAAYVLNLIVGKSLSKFRETPELNKFDF
jgi:hypothetical protein